MNKITEEDIERLTPKHRVLLKHPGAPKHLEPVEMGLWRDSDGFLLATDGTVIAHPDGARFLARSHIVGIIDPPYIPEYGDVIGNPRRVNERAVCLTVRSTRNPQWLASTSHNWHSQEWAEERLAEGWVTDPDGMRK